MNNQWCHTGLIPNKRGDTIKGMTGASAEHAAEAKFSKMSDFQNGVSMVHVYLWKRWANEIKFNQTQKYLLCASFKASK